MSGCSCRRGEERTSPLTRWWCWVARVASTATSPPREWPSMKRGVPGYCAVTARQWLTTGDTYSDTARTLALVRTVR